MFGIAALVAAPGSPAAAQGGDRGDDPHGIAAMREERIDDERAHSHFRVGTTFYREGRFAEAAQEFERAFALSPRPSLRFNAYLAYRDAGDLANATANLRSYLELDPDAEEHDVLERRLHAMEASLAEQRAAAEANEAERARLEAERARLEAERQALAARNGDGDAAEDDGSGPNVAGWTDGGAGAGLLLGSGVAGLLAGARVRSLEDACPGNVCPSSFDLEGERAAARRAAVTTDVMLFTGIAALTTGVLLLVLGGDDEDEPPPVTAGCGPNGCGVELRMGFR